MTRPIQTTTRMTLPAWALAVAGFAAGPALALQITSLTPQGEVSRVRQVVASFDQPTQRDVRIDLARYPELREALRRAEAVFVPDIQRDPMFEDERRRWAEQRLAVDVRSVLAVPVVLHGRQSGVFLIRTRRADPELRAVIAADGAVPHRRVIGIIDLLRQEHVERFAINVDADDLEKP